MNDILSFDVRPYIQKFTAFLHDCRQNDIQVLDNIYEFPKIKKHPRRYPIPEQFSYYASELMMSFALEALSSPFVYTNPVDQRPVIAKLFNSFSQEVSDWFYCNPVIDEIMLDMALSATDMVRSTDVYRSITTLIDGTNAVLVMGEDYRIVEYEEIKAREIAKNGWTKQLGGLANYLHRTFSRPAGNLPPLTSVITVSQMIHLGLTACFKNIAMDDRLYINQLLNSVGQNVDSIGNIIKPLLMSTGLVAEIANVVSDGGTYTFEMSNKGRVTIEPSTSSTAIDKRFYELNEVVESGGYLPRSDREFYENELKRR